MSLVSDGGTLVTAPFVANNSQFTELTMFCYFKFASTPGLQVPLAIAGTATGQQTTGLFSSSVGAHIVGMTQLDNTGAQVFAQFGTGPSTGVWYPTVGTLLIKTNATIQSPQGLVVGTAGSIGTATWNQIQIGFRQINNAAATGFMAAGGEVAEVAIWNVALTGQEANALVIGKRAPWFVRRDKLLCYLPLRNNLHDFGNNHLPFTMGGTAGSTFTGDHPITEGPTQTSRTFMFNSNPAVGTIGVTQAAQTAALTGTVVTPATGTIASTQAAQTAAMTGGVSISGTIASTQAAQTAALTGGVKVGGTIASTQAAQTAALTGGVKVSGTIASTQATQTTAQSGIVGFPVLTGTIASTQAAQTTAQTGLVLSKLTGTIASTQAAQTAALTGTVSASTAITGIIASIQAPQTAGLFGNASEDDLPLRTAQDIINFALRAVGAVGVGQTPLAEDNQDALSALNSMIGLWSKKRWLSFHTTDNSFVSTGSVAYSVGPGQNFNVPSRPNRLEKAFFRQFVQSTPSSVDYPLQILESREDYDNIALKSLQSWPQYIFYDPSWPTGWVYPWPVPQSGIYELHLTFRGQEMQEYTTYTQVINLPPEYYEALWTNLCLRIAPIYGFPVSDDIRRLANDSLMSIRAANAAIARLTLPTVLKRNALYNIYSDQSY